MDSQGEEFRTASLVGSVHPLLPPPPELEQFAGNGAVCLSEAPSCFIMANGLISSYITSSLLIEVSLFHSVVCMGLGSHGVT